MDLLNYKPTFEDCPSFEDSAYAVGLYDSVYFAYGTLLRKITNIEL